MTLLKEEITKFQQERLPDIPKETLDTLIGETERLAKTDLTDHSRHEGDQAPAFSLPNAVGETITFEELLQQGPLVISFYRGAWCPYCNLELNALQRALPDIEAQGANLVAISPNLPDKSLSSVEKHNLDFEVLSDQGNQVARDYGLVFSLGDKVRPVLDSFGFNIPAHNGDDSWELPVPATYVVDTDGTITYSFVNVDYTQRAEPTDIIATLKQMNGGNGS